jgi:hypothetical protein
LRDLQPPPAIHEPMLRQDQERPRL